jgi:glycosyltransferase involved in cell wall biosynthesis
MRQQTGLDCIGINNALPNPAIPAPRHPPAPGEPLELLFLSNFIRSKGFWIAALALRELVNRGAKARLTFAGSWRDQMEREQFFREFSAEIDSGWIHLAGHVEAEAKQSLLRRSHFLLLPTRHPFEGQPLAILEAMNEGILPICTNQGGIPDLFAFDESSRLIRPEHDDPQCIAHSIEAISSDRVQYELLSKVCYTHAKQNLRFAEAVDRILQCLTETLRS